MCSSITSWFSLVFPWLLMTLSICLFISYLCIFSGEVSAQIFCPFIYWVSYFPIVKIWELVIYPGYNALSDMCLVHIFSYPAAVSSLSQQYFLKSKNSSFDDVLFVSIFLLGSCFWCSKKSLPKQRSQTFPHVFL